VFNVPFPQMMTGLRHPALPSTVGWKIVHATDVLSALVAVSGPSLVKSVPEPAGKQLELPGPLLELPESSAVPPSSSDAPLDAPPEDPLDDPLDEPDPDPDPDPPLLEPLPVAPEPDPEPLDAGPKS
jgi:hypothetical protein